MSITLLWHTFVYPDGAPMSGLCRKNNEEFIFIISYEKNYKESKFTLFRPNEDDLLRVKAEHERDRNIIGGFKDYGEAFKDRKQMSSGFMIKGVALPHTDKMERIETFSYTDIINPYQQHN